MNDVEHPGQILNPEFVEADYLDQQIPYYQGNPLIEALPPILTQEKAIDCLQYYPYYSEVYRQWEPEQRLHLIQNSLVDLFEPLSIHLDLEQRISRVIRVGYRARNPIEKTFWNDVHTKIGQLKSGAMNQSKLQNIASGFAIIGISGGGKTTAVNRVLNIYPQVIAHNRYHKQNFNLLQIVWLRLQCPPDGSTRTLCFNFFQTIDNILGTNYYVNYANRGRATKGQMMEPMARVSAIHSLGVLVIDEIQDLDQASSGGAKEMLNFFVQLVNTIGLPVILIGSYKALPILKGEFRQARRGTGQGDLVWDRMKNDDDWQQFLEALWRYQYTQKSFSLNSEVKKALYDETQGITDYAVKVFMLAQFRAITTGKEIVTPGIIRSVAHDSLRMSKGALAALRYNNIEDLHKFEDLFPIDLETSFSGALSELKKEKNKTRSPELVTTEQNSESPTANTNSDLPSQAIVSGIAKSPKQSDVSSVKETLNSPPNSLTRSSRNKLAEIASEGKTQKSTYETLNSKGFVGSIDEFFPKD